MITAQGLIELAAALEDFDDLAFSDAIDRLTAQAIFVEKSGRESFFTLGYLSPALHASLRRGSEVTIAKGALVYGTFPKKVDCVQDAFGRTCRIQKATRKVKAHNVFNGTFFRDHAHRTPFGTGYCWENASISYAGSGGYWNDVDLNDVIEMQDFLRDLPLYRAVLTDNEVERLHGAGFTAPAMPTF